MIEIAEKLAKRICNKNIAIGKVFYQNTDTIFYQPDNGDHMCVIHEIAHWIAADDSCKHLDNLGLPLEEDEKLSEKLQKRMYEEESMACLITKYLQTDYFSDDINSKNIEYVDYLYRTSKRIAVGKKLDYKIISDKAIDLYKKFNCEENKFA